MRNGTNYGLAQLYSAVFLIGGAPLFAKLITMPAHEITGVRALFGVVALGGFLILLRERFLVDNKRDGVIVFFVGTIMTAHWVSYFHSIQVSTVAIALIGFFTFPVITVFLEPLFFRHIRLTYTSVFSALGVFFGAVLLIGLGDTDDGALLGFLWGNVAAVLLALRNILVKRHLAQYPGTVVMLYQMIIAAVVLLPMTDWGGGLHNTSNLIYLLALGVIFTAAAHSLFVNSLRYLSVKTVSVIFCMQPVVGVLLAAVLLDEIPEVHTVIGGAIIVTIAAYESLRAATVPEKPPRS